MVEEEEKEVFHGPFPREALKCWGFFTGVNNAD